MNLVTTKSVVDWFQASQCILFVSERRGSRLDFQKDRIQFEGRDLR